MAEYFEDPQTGRVYRQVGEQYVEVDRAAAETGPLEAAAVGAGATLTGLARGAQMRLGQMTGNRETFYGAALPQWQDEAALAGLRRERPLSTTAGGVLPYLAAPGAGAGLAVSAGTGAALGALEPQGDPMSSIYAGAAGGAGAWGLAAGARAARAGRTLEAGERAVRGEAGAAPGGAAGRVQAAIQARGQALRSSPRDLEGPSSLEDLARAGERQAVEDAGAIASGTAPEAARAARAQALGYDPALLGGKAMTHDPGSVHQWAVKRADELGFELTPGEIFDSPMTRKIESAARSTPWASAPLDAMQARNQENFNRIVNRALGVGEDTQVTQSNLNRAADWVDDQFARVTTKLRERGGVPAGGLEARLEAIAEEWKGYGIELPISPILKFKRADQTFDPQGILAARQKLSQFIRQAKSTGQTTAIEPYSQMITAIDDAVQASAQAAGKTTFGKAEVDALKQAREVYRLLLALEKPGVWKEEKNVLMGPMYRALRTGYRNEMRGRKEASSGAMRDLIDAVRVREAVMKELVNDSGTATRLTLQNLANMNIGAAGLEVVKAAPVWAYLQAGKIGRRTLSPEGAAQLRGIWGSTW